MADIEEYHHLKKLIAEGKCVPFLGAKISWLAGCKPDREIIAKFAEEGYLTTLIADMQGRASSDPDILGSIRQTIYDKEKSYHAFDTAVLSALSTKHDDLMSRFKPFVQQLVQLNPNLKILTTNFDSSLTECGLFTHENIYWDPNDFTYANFTKQEPGIFHLHNSASGAGVNNLVYRPETYIERYSDFGFSAFLYSTLQQHSMLFLGYSLKDVALLNFFKGLKKYSGREIKEHYAILSEEAINAGNITVQEYYDLFNIRVINYGEREAFETTMMGWFSASPTVSTGEDVGPVG